MRSIEHDTLGEMGLRWLAARCGSFRGAPEVQVAPQFVADGACLAVMYHSEFMTRCRAWGRVPKSIKYDLGELGTGVIEEADILDYFACVFGAKATRADFLGTFGGRSNKHANRATPVANLHWVVAEAGDGAQAIECVQRTQPDLLLLDVRMPAGSGIDVLRELRRRDTLPPTLLLTTFDDDDALLEGMRAGARGFVLKDIRPERLYEAIRRIAAGQTLFQPALTERAFAQLGSAAPADATAEALTPRETEVLRLMAGGFSNKEIARALGTAEGTIKNHVSSLLGKLGVRDRTRAVLKGMQEGYL